MAIEVKFNPQDRENRKYSAECPSCKSVVEWLYSDAKHVRVSERSMIEHVYIDCPVCEQEMSGV